MTYSISGSWNWNWFSANTSGSSAGQTSVFDADIDACDRLTVDNPGGPFDNHSIRSMQRHVNEDTITYVDGSGHDRGDGVLVRYDDRGHDVDTVVLDLGDFGGDFCLDVQSLQTIDKLNLSNVKTFSAVDSHGNTIGPILSAQNVLGGGESGDQNGDAFGDGSYTIRETEGGGPAFYKITYLTATATSGPSIWTCMSTAARRQPKISTTSALRVAR